MLLLLLLLLLLHHKLITGDSEDDGNGMIGRDGMVYSSATAKEFGETWQVNAAKGDAILLSPTGGPTSSSSPTSSPSPPSPPSPCTYAESPLPTLDELKIEQAERLVRAERACKDALSSEAFDNCVYDVLLTDDVEWGDQRIYNGEPLFTLEELEGYLSVVCGHSSGLTCYGGDCECTRRCQDNLLLSILQAVLGWFLWLLGLNPFCEWL